MLVDLGGSTSGNMDSHAGGISMQVPRNVGFGVL